MARSSSVCALEPEKITNRSADSFTGHSVVRHIKACFGWIPSNSWIFLSFIIFLMPFGNSLSVFVSFWSYRRLFNVATSFVNGPLLPMTFSWQKELIGGTIFKASLLLSMTVINDPDSLDRSDLAGVHQAVGASNCQSGVCHLDKDQSLTVDFRSCVSA